MKKYLTLILFTITLLSLVGCTNKEEGAAGQTTLTAANTSTPAVTFTPSPEPINTIVPTPTDVPATVDSGEEIFIELTEQQTEDIRSIAIGFSGDPYGASLTHWMTAYYTYFEKGDVEIPVVIKATPEEVKEVYSGQWIPVYEAYSEDNIIHAYGVLSASEIKEVIEEDIFSSIKISADDSVKVQGESYFLTLSYPHVNISSYRHNGDVYIWQEDGIYYFFGTPYPG